MKTLFAILCLVSLSALADVQICYTVSDDDAAKLSLGINETLLTVEDVAKQNALFKADQLHRKENAKVAEKLNAVTKAKADEVKAVVEVELQKGE